MGPEGENQELPVSMQPEEGLPEPTIEFPEPTTDELTVEAFASHPDSAEAQGLARADLIDEGHADELKKADEIDATPEEAVKIIHGEELKTEIREDRVA
jgi:hypothetical protein